MVAELSCLIECELHTVSFSGQKLKEELSKWKDKMRIKRPKKQKLKAGQDLLRKLSVDCVSNEDDASSRESSIHSQEDSDRVRPYVKGKMTVCETRQIHCCFLAKSH